jgi:hypothetical protein
MHFGGDCSQHCSKRADGAIYKALSEDGNPSFGTVLNVLAASFANACCRVMRRSDGLSER